MSVNIVKKQNMFRSVILISSLIFLSGCFSEEVLITEKTSPGTYGPGDNTILFFKSVKVFHEAKGLARFPDGGPIDILYYNVSLYSYDTVSANLNKITSLGEMKGWPSRWRSRLSSENHTISFSLQYMSPNIGTSPETFDFKPGIYYLSDTDNQLQLLAKEGTMVDVSPDGKKICYLTERDSIYKIYIADLTTKKIQTIKLLKDFVLIYPEWDKTGDNLLLYSKLKTKKGYGVIKLNLVNKKLTPSSLSYKTNWGQELKRSNIKRLTRDITFIEWGIDLSHIVPKSSKNYINDLVELKGNVNYRKAVLEELKDQLNNDDIRDILKQIDKYKKHLEGYEKAKYETYSENLTKLLEELLIR